MFADVRSLFGNPRASIDEICSALRATQPRGGAKRAKTTAKTGRHVRWTRSAEYACVARGRDFANAAELDERWAAGDISLADMYIFHHCEADKLAERSQVNPLWEAVYYLSDSHHYVRVQKCHLRYAYEQAGRTDKALAWSVDEREDGSTVPYWVDRHAFSVLKIK
jgi:hypothetical protein